MTKWLLLLAALGFGGWYALIGGRRLDEEQVRAFYERQAHAVYSRDPEALCRQLAKKSQSRLETHVSGRVLKTVADSAQNCQHLHDTFKFFEAAGERAGGILTLEYEYQLIGIRIAPDHRSATVQTTSTLKMGESFLQYATTSTERLERWMGEVQLVDAEAQTRVQWKPGALADPDKYFQSQ